MKILRYKADTPKLEHDVLLFHILTTRLYKSTYVNNTIDAFPLLTID